MGPAAAKGGWRCPWGADRDLGLHVVNRRLRSLLRARLGGYGGWGFAGPVGFYGRHRGYRVYGAFVNPYWDPYDYPFGPTVQYPVKTVSFQNGRVVAFQLLTPSAY